MLDDIQNLPIEVKCLVGSFIRIRSDSMDSRAIPVLPKVLKPGDKWTASVHNRILFHDKEIDVDQDSVVTITVTMDAQYHPSRSWWRRTLTRLSEIGAIDKD